MTTYRRTPSLLLLALAAGAGVVGGTDVDCTGVVPADVSPHLPVCSGR